MQIVAIDHSRLWVVKSSVNSVIVIAGCIAMIDTEIDSYEIQYFYNDI